MAGAVVLGLLLLFAVAGGVLYIVLREKEFEIAQLQSQRTADALKVSQDAQAIAELKSQQAEERAASSAARAATQEYYASILQIREQRLLPDPEPGWTWKALESLEKIASSKADGKDHVVLRSMIADALTTPDLREIGRIENVPNTASLAVSNDGKLLAAGDWAGNPSQVRIYGLNDRISSSGELSIEFELLKTCSVDTTTDFLLNEILEKLYPARTLRREGMHVVDFSPDDKQIAVGTRNGNIMIWQIDSDTPVLLFNRRYPEKNIDRIQFSKDGNFVFSQFRMPYVLHALKLDGLEHSIHFPDLIRDFTVTDNGDLLVVGSGEFRRSSLNAINDYLSVTATVSTATSLALDRKLTTTALASLPPALHDPLTGRMVANLESDEDADRPGSLQLSSDTSLVIGGTQPQNMTFWDALSGRQLLTVTYPGNELPRFIPTPESNRLYVFTAAEMIAYQLRGTSRPSQRRQDSGGLTQAELPISNVMIGRQFIRAFDVREDLQRIATLEGCTFPIDSLEESGAWTRVCLGSQLDEHHLETWTCVCLEEAPRNTFTDGESIRLLPDGNSVAFTSGILGNFVVADTQGFRFLSGVGFDVASRPVASVVSDRCVWHGMPVSKSSATKGFRAAVAFRMPFSFRHANQRLVLKLNHGNEVKEYSLGPDKIDAPGWYLFSLEDIAEAEAGDWKVEAELVNVGADFWELNADAATQDDKVVPGPLFLLPWQCMKHGDSTSQYPLRLGPICLRKDGGLAAVVESWTLHQWDADLKASRPEYWRDFDNSEEDMHGLVATDGGVVVGTDSGLVALVNKDGQATFLEKARTESGTFDSRDGVTAIAVNDQNRVAVAGNLQGQIRLFELPAGSGVPAIVTDAHRTQIMALAITENGQRLASSDSTGALKFWKRHQDRLELLFEICFDRIIEPFCGWNWMNWPLILQILVCNFPSDRRGVSHPESRILISILREVRAANGLMRCRKDGV
jgi:WD40 repeat protein